jgi:hypothetical protein
MSRGYLAQRRRKQAEERKKNPKPEIPKKFVQPIKGNHPVQQARAKRAAEAAGYKVVDNQWVSPAQQAATQAATRSSRSSTRASAPAAAPTPAPTPAPTVAARPTTAPLPPRFGFRGRDMSSRGQAAGGSASAAAEERRARMEEARLRRLGMRYGSGFDYSSGNV